MECFFGEALIAKLGWYGVEQYTGVKYLSSGNINFSTGTIEFYLKPLSGFINDKKEWRKIFICMYDKEFINNKRFCRWFRMDCSRKLGKRKFRVYEKDMHTKDSVFLAKPFPELREGKWYHLAYCWDREKRWFFIDGKLFATNKSRGPNPEAGIPKAGTHIFVGSGPHGGEASHALIDELKIWDRVKYKEDKR